MDMTAAAPVRPLIEDHRRRLVVFWFLMAALFMATLDNQIVSTALPTIVGEFGALERFGWVGSAYLLAMSAVMPVYGKLGDLFGRKYVMLAAISIFVAGSLLCGLAWSMDSLISARIFQGLGGGGIMVSIFSINADLFEPRKRARYQSYSSLMLMASGSIGPTLGGTMSDLFGWRSIFLINLPIGIVIVTGIALLLPHRRPTRQPTIDVFGALLLAGVTTSIVLAADAVQLFKAFFAWQTLLVLAAGMLCAIFFVVVERRVSEPVMPLRLFKDPTFPLLIVISLTSGGIGIGLVNYLALFLQTTTGLSPTVAGLFFICATGGIVCGSLSAGRLIARYGRYKPFVVTGLTLNIVSLLLMSQLQAGTPLVLVGLLLTMQGLAIGFGQQAPVIGVQNSAPKADTGAATGAVTLSRMGGAAIAISIYGAIIGTYLGSVSLDLPGVESPATLTPKLLATLSPEVQHQIGMIYANAFESLFQTGALIAFVGLVAGLMLKNVRLPAAGETKA
ncbi:EmrB/QacA subfamily drug resistance transporter [Pseudorhizobium tarimense]|uniref:EmrB/QacA subfamily drug resistance transporter n=1 Tax=Pseudorhizobium tarimense TaxID=1079109 RepID=A0ABV2H0M9_9HYPH|nr:MDR family MFS transporter [Pseudorhizobium tarimense]MCJ8517427.1 MFS transporter [Pseudorhizobium tarimense]